MISNNTAGSGNTANADGGGICTNNSLATVLTLTKVTMTRE